MMRFLHTSDWQIGEPFNYVDDETLALLRAERLEVIGRIGVIATNNGASAVLVAGDVYDGSFPSLELLLRPIERMRQFPAIEWHLIPGNHDAHTSNSPWERLLRAELPTNIVLHTTSEARPIGDGAAWLLPSILTNRHMSGDPTAYFDGAATPAGALRIGLAHGSVMNFGSTESSTNNLLAGDRAKTAHLDYLALGDWHGSRCVGDRTWYSGTPETDGFDIAGGGEVLLVDVSPNEAPRVTPIPSGRFVWRSETASLNSLEDVKALESRIRALHSDLSRVLLKLRVDGALNLAARQCFEQAISTTLGSALRTLKLDSDALFIKPTAADLGQIDHVGFVRVAADRLTVLAQDVQNPEREIATAALERLYVMQLRQAAEVQ